MSLSSNADATKRQTARSRARTRLEDFPVESVFATQEQMQRFELLRLAFFVLKLRKLNDQIAEALTEGTSGLDEERISFQRNLLHHIIFHQILTLTRLDAREQAMQIISACHTQK